MRDLDAAAVWDGLGVRGAIDALEDAVAVQGIPAGPQRLHLSDRDQQLLVMPAMAEGWAGVKLITIVPDNPTRELPLVQGTYTLFEPPGLSPSATAAGEALTQLRTAAVSGLATRHMAREDAVRLVIFGAGAQGRAHLLAMAAVRELRDVRVVALRQASIDAFLAFAAEHVDVPVQAGTADDVEQADLVCTCTTSGTPVFDGSRLPAGAHVNAIGAYRPSMTEVDAEVVRKGRVVVETREAAFTEEGDLMRAEEDGGWSREQVVADLGEVLAGTPVRHSADDRTLFASVGVAYEDLVLAKAVATAAASG